MVMREGHEAAATDDEVDVDVEVALVVACCLGGRCCCCCSDVLRLESSLSCTRVSP